MSRFYLAFGFLLCEESADDFDSRLHMQELASCLTQLRELYAARREQGGGGGQDGREQGEQEGQDAPPTKEREREREHECECKFSAYALVFCLGLGSMHDLFGWESRPQVTSARRTVWCVEK